MEVLKIHQTVELSERIKWHLIQTLDWWEEHQFDTWGRDHDVYDDEPDFVTTAKELYTYFHGTANPKDWIWLRSVDG